MCLGDIAVKAGDRVITSFRRGDWICASVGGTGTDSMEGPVLREFYGWLPVSGLTLSKPEARPPLDSWLGRWKLGRNTIRITPGKRAGTIAVDGLALGPGSAPSTGQIQGIAKPKGKSVMINDGTCHVRLTLIDGVLIASSNDVFKCGGMSAVFDGIYRQQ